MLRSKRDPTEREADSSQTHRYHHRVFKQSTDANPGAQGDIVSKNGLGVTYNTVATETSRKKETTPGPVPDAGTNGAIPHESVEHHQSFWLWVMCLTGVDYFSTLGYQPSIAFEATGLLSPLATTFLVLVTLFGAVPVYRHVAGSSPHGQGSIAMLERLVHGWTGKFLVLVLLGFAATDFVITKTLSAADAAEHLIHNPLWEGTPAVLHHEMLITMGLLMILGATFLRGFREVPLLF